MNLRRNDFRLNGEQGDDGKEHIFFKNYILISTTIPP